MAAESEEKFTFFWKNKSPFSQWHTSNFCGKSLFDENDSTHQFINCEQWMMYNKAVLFKDEQIGKEILSTTNPRKIKEMGRKVKNFNEDVWIQHRERIVYEGNKLKFSQSLLLQKQLIETEGTTLVEASPFDRIWGIGLKEDDPRAKSRASWKGLNLLGEALTRVRNDLFSNIA